MEQTRQLLFGHERGLPGERWWARPLVARDMLHWYMPSKYGLAEFQLKQYYEMQAERFRKRPTQTWVKLFKETCDRIQARKQELENFSDHNPDLAQILHLLNSREFGVTEQILNESLLAQPHVKSHRETRTGLEIKSLFVNRRHRFVDPLFRRRRLKWMERFLAGMNNAKEIKYNRHFTRHPDLQPKWPSNLGSVTVRWPNRRN
jgi:hypothetical protein